MKDGSKEQRAADLNYLSASCGEEGFPPLRNDHGFPELKPVDDRTQEGNGHTLVSVALLLVGVSILAMAFVWELLRAMFL